MYMEAKVKEVVLACVWTGFCLIAVYFIISRYLVYALTH